MTPIEPDACRHYGQPPREHDRSYTEGVGWHVWTAPTGEQRQARMIARRAARTTGGAS